MCDPCCWLLFALLVLFSTAASRSEGVGPQPEGPNAELSGATERGSETLILNPGPQSHQPCRTALCRSTLPTAADTGFSLFSRMERGCLSELLQPQGLELESCGVCAHSSAFSGGRLMDVQKAFL